MVDLNLNKILTENKVDLNYAALQLFPNNLHPRLSLNRVLKGGSELNSTQISKLAFILDVNISDLFETEKWKMKYLGEYVYKLKMGRYTAELDSTTNITKIWDKESLFHEKVIVSTSMPLKDYISELQKIVTKYSEK